MRRFLLIAVLAAVGLLYGLTIATGSTSPLAEYFWWIIALCALLMLVLASVLTRYVLLLMRDKSKGVFGSQIAWRLSRMFYAGGGIVGCVPVRHFRAVHQRYD